MATSIPPHNLGEVCDALVRVIDEPDVSIDELLEIVPGPDFPTGGIVCGRSGIRRGYLTGRSTITIRARTPSRRIGQEPPAHRRQRDPLPASRATGSIERIAELVNDDRIKGISAIRDESDLKEPVRIILELKRDADPEIVLNQLYQFSPLQDSFSIIFLALVDGKPRMLPFKSLLQEFIRHGVIVIRRRTQFLLAKARSRKHTVEGSAAGPRQHRRSDPRDPLVGDSGRGQGPLDGHRGPVGPDSAGPGRRGFWRLPDRIAA